VTGAWLCTSANGMPATAHETREEAEREALRRAPAAAVAWWCEAIEPPETPVEAPRAAEPIVTRVLDYLRPSSAPRGETA
jgi:hypothetical protein